MAKYLNLKMFVHDRKIVKIFNFEDENSYLNASFRSPKLFYIEAHLVQQLVLFQTFLLNFILF